jgi:crossover junction endodeoxyribonuclease RuvC
MKLNGNLKDKKYRINNELHSKIFIGIDPGKNGGVAIINEIPNHEAVVSFRCPKTPVEMAFSLASTIPTDISYENVLVTVEHVHAMPKNGVVSMFSFGQNLGQWEGILGAFELNVTYAGPKTWMYHYDCKPNMERRERKRYLRGLAEKLFPNVKMTFNVSDALLIANYNKEMYYKSLADMQGRNRENYPA